MHNHNCCNKSNNEPHNHNNMLSDFKKRFWVSLIITLPILILSPTIRTLFGFAKENLFLYDQYVSFVLSSFVFFYGGYPFTIGMIKEIKNRNLGMMTLIAVAIITAYFYSSLVVFGLNGKIFFWELVTLIDIMLIGHWIEMKSVMSASSALEKLAKLMPDNAHKFKNNEITDVPLKEIKVGDILLVKPGEKVPVDGKIIEGKSYINESMLTGESNPVLKKEGDFVIGGSLNSNSIIKISVERTGEDSYLSKIIQLVKHAQDTKSKTQSLVDKSAKILTIIALLGGLITLFIWFFIMNKDFAFALERTVTVMIITCPHALGLAVPLVISVSTALAAKNGFLIRNRTAFEDARKINVIIFDKTGTLTKGEFKVSDIIVINKNYTESELLKISASIEMNSEHPIAKTISQSVEEKYEVSDFKNIPGIGVQAIINDKKFMIVGSSYFKDKDIIDEDKRINNIRLQGKTLVYIIENDILIGCIGLADEIRDESRSAIKLLKGMGIKCIMITGDTKQVAKWVSEELELDEFYAQIMPDEKSNIIKKIQQKYKCVSMVGDGINDAPALVQSNVGIAIGAGTDIAIESADIVLVNNNPEDIVRIIILARKTYIKMKQNLLWATGYNAIAIPIAAGILYKWGILLSPAIGAIFMSLSTVIVAINAKLLKI